MKLLKKHFFFVNDIDVIEGELLCSNELFWGAGKRESLDDRIAIPLSDISLTFSISKCYKKLR